jgi:hypothetical protein
VSSGHISPCDVETNGGDCDCLEVWRDAFLQAKETLSEENERLRAAFRPILERLVEKGSGYVVKDQLSPKLVLAARAALSEGDPKEGT